MKRLDRREKFAISISKVIRKIGWKVFLIDN